MTYTLLILLVVRLLRDTKQSDTLPSHYQILWYDGLWIDKRDIWTFPAISTLPKDNEVYQKWKFTRHTGVSQNLEQTLSSWMSVSLNRRVEMAR